jgi:rubrerythrin
MSVRRKAALPLIVLFCLIFIPALFVYAQSKYSQTISALQKACVSEIKAYSNYMAYAEKAKIDNYPGIAYLFVSFADSELIHALNMKRVLSDLGISIKEAPAGEVIVSSTKSNLKNALDFELQDIDHRYPEILEQIKPEKHDGAIHIATYAWQSEMQHRDLIQKMLSGTGMLFEVLAQRVESTDAHYFVCQKCGFTVVKLQKDACSICKSPASNYKEVQRPDLAEKETIE